MKNTNIIALNKKEVFCFSQVDFIKNIIDL